jgi:plastocyanin
MFNMESYGNKQATIFLAFFVILTFTLGTIILPAYASITSSTSSRRLTTSSSVVSPPQPKGIVNVVSTPDQKTAGGPPSPLPGSSHTMVPKDTTIQEPNIKASYIYQSHTMVLGKDVKNLVIVIPNEGHEDPTQPKEFRIVNQPYLPRNAVVNVGTIVTWFNADVKHPHRITLVDNSTKNAIYDSGIFKNYTASRPIKFNNTGTFTYSGPSFDKAVPRYKMNGTLTVVNQPLSTSLNNTSATTTTASNTSSSVAATTTNTTKNVDTITTLMVPAKLLDKAVSEIKGQGLGIDNQYLFKSLRGGGSSAGGDKNQVLLVLTSSGRSLNEVIAVLNKISPTMPYS